MSNETITKSVHNIKRCDRHTRIEKEWVNDVEMEREVGWVALTPAITLHGKTTVKVRVIDNAIDTIGNPIPRVGPMRSITWPADSAAMVDVKEQPARPAPYDD
jgi:hypothetical protein